MSELIFDGVQRGPLTTRANSSVNQWAGRTAVASGDSTVTVSSALVQSDSIVFTSIKTSTASQQDVVVTVGCVVDSSYMIFTTNNAIIDSDFTIHWEIKRTK